jgi:alanine racemase
VIGTLRISLGALRRNAATLKTLVGSRSETAFVVKSNAYGHGIVETALAIEPLASRICVFAPEEALELRDGGVTAPILVLGPVDPSILEDVLAAGAEIALWDTREFVRALAAAARKRHVRAKVHIKVNTGLNRLGLEPHDVADAVQDYLRVGDVQVAGIFSHLAAAEEIDSPYTMYQLDRFNEAFTAAEPLLGASGVQPVRHIAASAAAMLWPQTRLDMVRVGIALYGLWPSEQTKIAMNGDAIDLEPALSYTSQLVVTRSVPAGAAIGYGGSFHAPRTMRIGVVPLGYADGIPRALSNKGALVVDGVRCPIVGRIAMNMTLLDLSHAPNAHVGSQVTLIGSDGGAVVTADDWGAWSDTINYEIVTRLPSTLSRSYVNE